MKQLKCEMCGSTDLIKQDGVFVCQTCGCKYSIEEVRKMMVEGTVEVTGTVKVDNSAAIENYLGMARNALDAGNNKEADEYCNKIIEIDTTNWAAWFIKGKAVGWQSTLANIRIAETINAFSKSLEYCPEDKKKGLGELCRQELENLHSALLRLRVGNFKTHPSENDLLGLQSDIQMILNGTVKFLAKAQVLVETDNIEYGRIINEGLCDAWSVVYRDYHGDDGHPGDYEFKRFLLEGNVLLAAFKAALVLLETTYDNEEKNNLIIQIYENMIYLQETLRDAKSYKVDFSYGWERYVVSRDLTFEAIKGRNAEIAEWQEKIREVKRITAKNVAELAQKKRDQYWADHKEEKERLDAELSSLQSKKKQLAYQIDELVKKKEGVPTRSILETARKERSKLQAQKNELGLFKIKEKKAVQEQIEACERKIADADAQMAVQQQEVEKEIEPIRAELNQVIAKIKEIENELNKDR